MIAIKLLLGVAAVSAALVAPAADQASASTRLGGVDMQRACDTQYPGFGLAARVLDQHNAYSWRCVAPWDNTRGIDVNRACANQYGGGAYAGLGDSRNPYSWYCQR